MKSLQYSDTKECFTDMEISKLERILDWMNSPNNKKELYRNRKDFGNFFREHDKRRGTSFIDIFPELENLYKKKGKK